MITYNHERFIEQAVESVLMQKVNFRYELVIGEDCSVDRTRDIIIQFQKKYPDRIRLLLRERNLGSSMNFIRTLEACQGEYVALLEGDDYWTSPYKLQRQVDFLDAHPECSACSHTVLVFFEDGKRRLYPSRRRKGILGLEDILASNLMQTCSVMFRNGVARPFPNWFGGLNPVDWSLNILNAQYGKIGFIDEVMAGYRIHSGGEWSKKNALDKLQETIEMLKQVNTHLNYKYDRTVRGTISACHLDLALECAREGNTADAWKYARICTAEYRPRGRLSMTLLIVMWLVVWFPRLYNLVVSAPKILAAAAHRI